MGSTLIKIKCIKGSTIMESNMDMESSLILCINILATLNSISTMEMDNLSLDRISMSESLDKVWNMDLEETKDPLIMMENGRIINLKEMES